ncbi:MAG TPA: molybdenum cofactor biosynthesis protein MoaE [Opitutaceae bacterium]|jgi:molybdopterin synthase catalytic subunit
MAFRLEKTPIDTAAVQAALADPRAGAFCGFDGRVRNSNAGREVLSLEYEAHGPLAEKEGERILAEARAKFRITGVECVHRTGRLLPGDIAVYAAAAAAHREDAFGACRYVIDEVKARVPIWKKEHYQGGSAEWINSAERGPPAK